MTFGVFAISYKSKSVFLYSSMVPSEYAGLALAFYTFCDKAYGNEKTKEKLLESLKLLKPYSQRDLKTISDKDVLKTQWRKLFPKIKKGLKEKTRFVNGASAFKSKQDCDFSFVFDLSKGTFTYYRYGRKHAVLDLEDGLKKNSKVLKSKEFNKLF